MADVLIEPMRILLTFAALALLIAMMACFGACTSSALPPLASTKGDEPDAGTAPSDAGAHVVNAATCIVPPEGGCNQVALCGPTVGIIPDNVNAVGSGGTIAPGTYTLTSLIAYGDAGASDGSTSEHWLRANLVVSAPSGTDDAGTLLTPFQEVVLSDSQPITTFNGTFETASNSISLRYECGEGSAVNGTYSADPADLGIFTSPPQGQGLLEGFQILQ